MISKWSKLSVNREYFDRVLSVDHVEYFYEGAETSMPFTVVNTSNWVVIVPMDKEGGFILVKQFRAGTETVTFEFPGGAVNLGEGPEKAAERELKEETGAVAERIEYLGSIAPNPAFMSNNAYVYLAEGCEIKSELNLDPFEDIEVLSVKRDELCQMIKNGTVNHSIVISAFALYMLKYSG